MPCATLTVTEPVVGAAKFTVISVSWSPTSVQRGKTSDFKVTVKNEGNAKGYCTLYIKFKRPGSPVYEDWGYPSCPDQTKYPGKTVDAGATYTETYTIGPFEQAGATEFCAEKYTDVTV